MAAKVWAVKLNRMLTQQEETLLLSLLPETRKMRLFRLKCEEKRREVLCAYGALWVALKERSPELSCMPEMEYGAMGKPYFPQRPDLHFNISHTEKAVLAGVADTPIGVDVETERAVNETLRSRLKIGETESFFHVWTRREARAKRAESVVSLGEEKALLPEERIVYPQLFPGVCGCVCLSGDEMLSVELCDMDELLKRVRDFE